MTRDDSRRSSILRRDVITTAAPARVILLAATTAVWLHVGLQCARESRADDWIVPTLPGGKTVVTDESADFLVAPESIAPDVKIARAIPTVDFAFFPCQAYAADIWSSWGEGCCADGKYYTTLGDHMHPAKRYDSFGPGHGCAGTAYVYEYDPALKSLRLLLDTNKLLRIPAGTYAPGKFHARLEMGNDGWLYVATHRGSQRATNDQYQFEGDWILRVHPQTAEAEIVAHGPVGKHSIPNGRLDSQRMIYYGGTARGTPDPSAPDEEIKFFAYDLTQRKLLHEATNGPGRGMILSESTGKVYYTPGVSFGPLMCYDPATDAPPREIPGEIGIRCATGETPQGLVYTISQGGYDDKTGSTLYSFDTKTEQIDVLGSVAVSRDGQPDYVASVVADPSGRYLYYTLGAHGRSETIGSPLVQYDLQTKTKKVIAFLTPFHERTYGVTQRGSYNVTIDEAGETVFITWNSKRAGSKGAWDVVTMTAVHIPVEERQP